jgi:ATP-dependent exoDNAse (exonuclease V) alpha subunit
MLKDGYEFAASNGNKEFSKKDQIYFLRNDNALGVKNGTLGEVVSINKRGDIEVNIKGGEKDKKVSFNIENYNHIDHGYASTVHKAQGVTVDRAYVMASKGYNKHIAYVAMSRHIGAMWKK